MLGRVQETHCIFYLVKIKISEDIYSLVKSVFLLVFSIYPSNMEFWILALNTVTHRLILEIKIFAWLLQMINVMLMTQGKSLTDSFDQFSNRNRKYEIFKSYSKIWMLSAISSCMD